MIKKQTPFISKKHVKFMLQSKQLLNMISIITPMNKKLEINDIKSMQPQHMI